MHNDYGEGLESEMDSLSDIGHEAEMDTGQLETELEPDLSGELVENSLEMEELPQEQELMEDLQGRGKLYEAEFEDRINSMSLADLKEERERLLEMGAMSGDEIAEQYESACEGQEEQDATDRLLSNFDKDELIQMRDVLSDLNDGSGENTEVADDTDDKPPQLKLTMKKRI
jgi:hypothetical protein